MKRFVSVFLTLALAFCLTACGKQADTFSIDVICESDDIYQIFYSIYFDDAYFGMGGMADYDHNALTPDTELSLMLSKSYLDGREDVSDFSIDFSPYGKDDTSEIGTTNRVYIPAEYGGSYTVVFRGDRDSGFTAELQENAAKK